MKLAEFWVPALGYTKSAWPHEPYVVLVAEDADRPHRLLQRVAEPKHGKSRVHIDVYSDDIEAEAKRIEKLGARRLNDGVTEENGVRWIVMADPEDNEFCVVEG